MGSHSDGPQSVSMMCTGIPEESRQNELYLQCQQLGGTFVRDKTTSKYQSNTTHLVVGLVAKTEKLLCALAAGIPIVDRNYIFHSVQQNRWIKDIGQYDIGSVGHPQMQGSKLFIKPLSERHKVKQQGGVFQGWNAVVILDDVNMQEIYRRILELGGGKVEKWTARHLSDLKEDSMRKITHVISHPNMLANEDFLKFLQTNDQTARVPTLAYIYVGDCLTRPCFPSPDNYDIRQRCMIDLLVKNPELKQYLVSNRIAFNPPTLGIRPPTSSSYPGPSRTETENSIVICDDFPTIIDDDDNVDEEMPALTRHPSQKRRASTDLGVINHQKRLRSSDPRQTHSQGTSSKDNDEEIIIEKEEKKQLNPIASLKQFAQTFMKQEAEAKQSKTLDNWVTKSPRVNLVSKEKDEDKEVVTLDDEGESSPRCSQSSVVTRRSTPSKNPQSKQTFLSQTRSGSIRKTPSMKARSLLHALSQDSQDSFMSDSSEMFDLTKIDPDPSKQHLYLARHMSAERRWHVHRLGLGPWVNGVQAPDTGHEQLSSNRCMIAWNCLVDKEGSKDAWMESCRMLRDSIDSRVYLPAAALYKLMVEAVRDHEDAVINQTALNVLMKNVQYHQPGPATDHSRDSTNSYLHLFSDSPPYLNEWSFNDLDPWTVIAETMQTCISSNGKNNSTSSSVGSTRGHSLVLKLFTFIAETDLNNWFDHCEAKDKLDFHFQPFLARVLCPKEEIGLSKNFLSLVKLYSQALADNAYENDLVSIRKLVGLASQILQFRDRLSKTGSNTLKLEMAKVLAQQFSRLQMSEQRLWAELYLLEPAWLSSLVSRTMVSEELGLMSPDNMGLRVVMTQVRDNVTMTREDSGARAVPVTSGPVTSTPMTRRTLALTNNNDMSPVKTVSRTQDGVKTVSKANIKVGKVNKWGETPLHTAAKKGNLVRMQQCLDTPGVDINAADFNGYTPLAEAVSNNHPRAVEMLLRFTPKTINIASYFSPSRKNAQAPRQKIRVDILKQNLDKDDMKNPFHEAVANNNMEIVSMIMETVAEEEKKQDSGFPTLAQLMESKTGKDESVMSLVISEDMKSLLTRFSTGEEKENQDPRMKETTIKDNSSGSFVIILENMIVKHLSSLGICQTYQAFKETSLDKCLEALQEGHQASFQDYFKWGKLEFEGGGFKATRFNRRPRFEVFQEKQVIAEDMRDLEKLVHSDSVIQPISTLLKSMKISKS